MTPFFSFLLCLLFSVLCLLSTPAQAQNGEASKPTVESKSAKEAAEREKLKALELALQEAEAEALAREIAEQKAQQAPVTAPKAAEAPASVKEVKPVPVEEAPPSPKVVKPPKPVPPVEEAAKPAEAASASVEKEEGPYELAPYVAPQPGTTARELFEAEHTFVPPGEKRRPQNWVESADERIKKAIYDNKYIEMRGDYRTMFAVDDGATEWATADSELKGDSFRFYSDPRKQNTFDPESYSSMHLKFDTHFPGPMNVFSELWFYPWAYRGVSNKLTHTGAFGDVAEIQYKYMGNRPVVNNETYRTTLGFNVQVGDVPVNHTTVDARTLAGDFGNTFNVPSMELRTSFQPFRNLWTSFTNPEKTMDLRVIPFLSQEYVDELEKPKGPIGISDDPMELIGHHIYWEPSPWLAYWDTNVTGQRFRRRWILDETDDSLFQRLRLLRGVSFKGEWGDTSFESLAASSLGPWDNYGDFNVFPWAARLKQQLPDGWPFPWLVEESYLGALWSMRTARREDDIDANNWATGFDMGVDFPWGTEWKGEIAASRFDENMTSDTGFYQSIDGLGFKSMTRQKFDLADVVSWGGPLDVELVSAHFDRDFNPPLATYDETAKDQGWGKNILWEDRKETDMRIRIGDSITSNRDVYGVNLRGSFWEDRVLPLVHFRHARSETENKFLQAVLRSELGVKVTPKLTSKFLWIYEDRPRLGLPEVQSQQYYKILAPAPETLVLYDVDAQNQGDILTTWSTGARYEFTDRLYVQGWVKRTNDYPRWPQAGTQFAAINPRGFPKYYVLRGRVGWTPLRNAPYAKNLGLAYEIIRNDWKYASSLDDNINMHQLECNWDLTPKVSLQTVYRIHRVYDVVDDARFENVSNYRSRHNVFFSSVYRFDANRRLTLSYGELGAYREGLGFFHNVLDTQHVLRVMLTGEF